MAGRTPPRPKDEEVEGGSQSEPLLLSGLLTREDTRELEDGLSKDPTAALDGPGPAKSSAGPCLVPQPVSSDSECTPGTRSQNYGDLVNASVNE